MTKFVKVCLTILFTVAVIAPERLSAEGLGDKAQTIGLSDCKRVTSEWRPVVAALSLLPAETLGRVRLPANEAQFILPCVENVRKMTCTSIHVETVIELVTAGTETPTGGIDESTVGCAVFGLFVGLKSAEKKFRNGTIAAGACKAVTAAFKSYRCNKRTEKIAAIAERVDWPTTIRIPRMFPLSSIKQIRDSPLSNGEKLLLQAELAARTRNVMKVRNAREE